MTTRAYIRVTHEQMRGIQALAIECGTHAVEGGLGYDEARWVVGLRRIVGSEIIDQMLADRRNLDAESFVVEINE